MKALALVLDALAALTLVYLVICVEGGHRHLLPGPLARWLAAGDDTKNL